MKPDKNTCLNCKIEISGRAKYCSDKCRMAYGRNPNKVGSEPEQKGEQTQGEHEQITTRTPEPEQDDFRAQLTKTDKTFYDRAMDVWGEPYYNFDWTKRESKCNFCGAKFSTELRLNRYCSYQHYSQSLKGS